MQKSRGTPEESTDRDVVFKKRGALLEEYVATGGLLAVDHGRMLATSNQD